MNILVKKKKTRICYKLMMFSFSFHIDIDFYGFI